MKKIYLTIIFSFSALIFADITDKVYLETLSFNEANWDSSERLLLEKNHVTEYSEKNQTLAILFFYTAVC